jgi:hypothetical protein
VVIEALNATLPVNPPAGVTVIVDVFPVVAPRMTVAVVPEIVIPGGTAGVTVTNSSLLPALKLRSPL